MLAPPLLPAPRAPIRPTPPVPSRVPAAPAPTGAPARAPAPAAAVRWVWESRFGPIVIEVRGDEVYVNGDRVEPHAP